MLGLVMDRRRFEKGGLCEGVGGLRVDIGGSWGAAWLQLGVVDVVMVRLEN